MPCKKYCDILSIFLEIPTKQVMHNEYSAAAKFADHVAFQPTSDDVQRVLYFLKTQYSNVTCNIVKEIFYKRNIIWRFQYFGSEALYRNLQWLSSNGLFVLYASLWKFVDEKSARKYPAQEPMGIGALENLSIAFQLYLLFGVLAIASFLLELAVYKLRPRLIVSFMLVKLRSEFLQAGVWVITFVRMLNYVYWEAFVNLRNCMYRINYTFQLNICTFWK